MTSSLLAATKELLAQTSRETWQTLAKEVGCTYSWLCQLEQDKIAEPGVNKIERLYKALGGQMGQL